jgi:hypothetical protein
MCVARLAAGRFFVAAMVLINLKRLPLRRDRGTGARCAQEAILDKIELKKLQAFLRRSLGSDELRVLPNPKKPDDADVHLGERKIASISVDDEDGDRSFAFEMKIPVGREVLQSYLRKLFENDRLTIAARARKTDSVELNMDGEFLGVISADDPKLQSFTLQIAILDFDLEEE